MRSNIYPCHLKAPLRETWRIEYEEALFDLPFFWDGLIFLKEPDATLAAYDERKKHRVWRYPHHGWLTDVVDGLLYFATRDGQLHVLEAETGRPRSVSTCQVEVDAQMHSGLLINMGSSSICAIDPTSGVSVWEHSPKGDPGFSGGLSAHGEVVFLGVRDGTFRALSVRDGSEIWRHDVTDLRWRNQGQSNPPGTTTGVASTFRDTILIRVAHEYVIACSMATGERAWTWTADSASAAVGGGACLYEDQYYVTGANGTYHTIDAASGRTVLASQLSMSLPKKLKKVWGWTPILVSETHLFVGSHDGHLVAFDRGSGHYVWSHNASGGGGVTRYFVSKDRRLYYADFSFRLYCLEEEGEYTQPVTDPR